MTTPVLRIVVPDQPFYELGLMLGQALVVKVEPGAVYTVIDDDTKDVIEDVALSEVENNLIIELDGEAIVQVEGFFAPALEGEAESYVYTGVTDASGVPQLVTGGDTLVSASDVMWGAAATDAGSAAPAGAGSEASSFADIPGWVLAGLGVGAAVGIGFAVAGMTSNSDSTTATAAASDTFIDVVFNLSLGAQTIQGLVVASGASASDQVGTAFLVATDYRITIVANNASSNLAALANWTGGANLGAGDVIQIVGAVTNTTGELTFAFGAGATNVRNSATDVASVYDAGLTKLANIQATGSFTRFTNNGSASRDLWTGGADMNGATSGNSIMLEFV